MVEVKYEENVKRKRISGLKKGERRKMGNKWKRNVKGTRKKANKKYSKTKERNSWRKK